MKAGVETQLMSRIGSRCVVNFKLLEVGTVLFYFDAEPNSSTPDSRFDVLWIECPWRIKVHSKVICGYLEEGTKVLSKLRDLIQCTVRNLEANQESGDLRIHFCNEYVLETFCYFSDGEQWELRCNDGVRIGVGEGFRPYERNSKEGVGERWKNKG